MLGSLFQSSLLYYAPLVIVALLVLMFIPSMMTTGAKPEGVGRAITCVLWKAFGLILVALSILQLSSEMLTRQMNPSEPVFSILILIFAIGVGIMVQASRALEAVDAASKAVPKLIFVLTCECVGGLIIVVTGLTLGINFLAARSLEGWEGHLVTLLLGIVLALGASLHVNTSKKASRKKK